MSPVLALLALAPIHAASAVEYRTTSVEGQPVRIIEINLRDPRVRIGVITASGFPKSDETFDSMVHRTAPAVAINGAYFDKHTKRPIGDIRVSGRTIYEGLMGTCLAVGADNSCRITRVVPGHRPNWSPFSTVLGCGPALLLNGHLDVQPTAEGFHDPHVVGSTYRMGVGYKKNGTLVLANIRGMVTFGQEAAIFRELGCVAAMNLDAGASQAMFVNGKVVQEPSRRLTNLLAVWISRK